MENELEYPAGERDVFDYSPPDPVSFFDVPDAMNWLVDGVVLEGETMAISAPKKCLATSIAVDLLLSVASGTPFLGHFKAATRRRVAYLSGPARERDVRAKARRICAARDLAPGACDVDWVLAMPRACDPDDLDQLALGLERRRVGLVVIDPLFLLTRRCPDVSASNVYEIGATLETVAERCLVAGATPVFVHHTIKNAGRSVSTAPLTLEDMAFSGIGEVARQWVLLNRSAAFDPEAGKHELNMAVGGSAGHASVWRVTIDEGRGGVVGVAREWRVRVEPHGRKASPVANVDGRTPGEVLKWPFTNPPDPPPKKPRGTRPCTEAPASKE